MPDEPIERALKQYIANAAGEGAISAAQRLSEALDVGLNEVLEAVQRLGLWKPAAVLAGQGSVTAGGPVAGGAVVAAEGTVTVFSADVAAATESLTVVRQVDVDELSTRASRGGLARLSANQRILAAVILIAAIFPVLPPEVQARILDDATLAAAVAAVLVLIKR
jgi:hypothetical protein